MYIEENNILGEQDIVVFYGEEVKRYELLLALGVSKQDLQKVRSMCEESTSEDEDTNCDSGCASGSEDQ